jgi:hypothetical protein
VRPFSRQAGSPAVDDPGDEERHVFCCDPETGLCGARIFPEEILDDFDVDEDDSAVLCEACRWRERDPRPCGAWLCRLRRWWRSR